jgi:hypothetical protein
VICSRVRTAVEDTCTGVVAEPRPAGQQTPTRTGQVRWPATRHRRPVPERGKDIVRLLDTAYDAVLARRLIGVHIRLLIQPRLLRDQLKSEQPIDLTPGRGDLIGMRRYDRCSFLHYAERLR